MTAIVVCLCESVYVFVLMNLQYKRIYMTEWIQCAHPFELMFAITMELYVLFTRKRSVQKYYGSCSKFGSNTATTVYSHIHIDTCARASKQIAVYVFMVCVWNTHSNGLRRMYWFALHAHVPFRYSERLLSRIHNTFDEKIHQAQIVNEQQLTHSKSEKERACVCSAPVLGWLYSAHHI